MKKALVILLGIGLIMLITGCTPTVTPDPGADTPDAGQTEQPKQPQQNQNTATDRVQNLDFIFNNQTLGKTTITMKRSEWNKLCDNYRYFYKNENCVHTLTYVYEKDGKSWTINNAGFRLRGNTSRFCPQGVDNGRSQGQMNKDWSADYYNYAEQPNEDYRQSHFKVDFEEFLEGDEEMKMAGCMKGVALKRMDNACSREIFCYDLFRKNGIWTAPRASHTRLIFKFVEDLTDNSTTTVDYGVYEMFEEVNKQSLKARDSENNKASNAWVNNKGDLWKCRHDLGGTWGMGVEDIRILFDEQGNRIGKVHEEFGLDLKTNKDKYASAESNLTAFINELNALENAWGNQDKINAIKAFYNKWFDVDFFIKTYAVSMVCGMDDCYWGNANNYYLYFDNGKKGSGKLYYIPFDYDNTMGCSIKDGGVSSDPMDWGRGENRPLIDKMLQVPEFKDKLAYYLRQVSNNEYWQFERCSALFQKWGAMCSPYLDSPDLDFHIGVNNFNADYTWNPGGLSLINKGNNIYDFTRNSFEKWLSGKGLSINELRDPYYPGFLININNPPEEAYARTVYIKQMEPYTDQNGKLQDDTWDELVQDKYLTGDEGWWTEDNGTIHISEHVHQTIYGYPFTEQGANYRIRVVYKNKNWQEIARSKEIQIWNAKKGYGKVTVTQPQWSIDDENVITFTSDPVIKIGNDVVVINKSDRIWEKYYQVSINTVDWDYQNWGRLWPTLNDVWKDGDPESNYESDEKLDLDKKVRDDARNKDITFNLYLYLGNDAYGAYHIMVLDYNRDNPIHLHPVN
ncbi:MAG: hypothetical protein IK102_08970 [Treponema sp.]|nr:hypothetical protein [Treponema sp.]